MDIDRFDDLTRLLGSLSSRRATLHTLVAGALAGAVALQDRGKAAACEPPGGRCTRTSQCCAGKCKKKGGKKGRCAAGGGCPAGQQPCDGGCIPLDQCCGGCPQGQTCCSFAAGGQCLDLLNDHDHCGHCTEGCTTASICLHGGCTKTCGAANACPGGCGCYDRVGAGGQACGFDDFLNCADVHTCNRDDDCGFGEGCFAGACAGKNVCLSTFNHCF